MTQDTSNPPTRGRLPGLSIEIEREEDGRYLAEVPTLPGVMVYGTTEGEAVARVKALALRVLAERLERCEAAPEVAALFQAA
jgi:predicted RNase H-like HicB family nuclease